MRAPLRAASMPLFLSSIVRFSDANSAAKFFALGDTRGESGFCGNECLIQSLRKGRRSRISAFRATTAASKPFSSAQCARRRVCGRLSPDRRSGAHSGRACCEVRWCVRAGRIDLEHQRIRATSAWRWALYRHGGCSPFAISEAGTWAVSSVPLTYCVERVGHRPSTNMVQGQNWCSPLDRCSKRVSGFNYSAEADWQVPLR
jgi:hypothetical protein